MRKAIFTIKIGTNPIWDLCIDSQIRYCNKYNIDYITIDQKQINWPFGPNPTANFYFEKLQAVSIFNTRKYDQVLYLDSDILITPEAINIFNEYPDPDLYYGFDENRTVGIQGPTMYGGTADIMDRDPYVIRTISNRNIYWMKNIYSKYIYFNMGVMLLGVNSVPWMFNVTQLLSVKDYPNIYDFNDQTYFNVLIQKYSKFKCMDYNFNRMHLGRRDHENERYKANFIHYAGPCLYGIEGEYTEQGKLNTVIKDYEYFFGART